RSAPRALPSRPILWIGALAGRSMRYSRLSRSATACAAPILRFASGSAFWPTGSPAGPLNCSRRLDRRALTVLENSRLILGLFTNPSSRAPMLAGLRPGFESGEKYYVTSRRDVLGGLDKHEYASRARNRARRRGRRGSVAGRPLGRNRADGI